MKREMKRSAVLSHSFERDQRRSRERKADVDRLTSEPFDWRRVYDHEYLLKFARLNDWNASRLQHAVETIDLRNRIEVNAAIAKRRKRHD